ncbi:glycine betaine/carnitine/choline ABC transporter, ATP-binding protein [Paucilactobacillus hokkaidonensis JCM 18461]|uniref:Quaternary amine transport ATP-binding protein n=2 Tax=Paucilactobacillus hokkaidonensis TaxID=1193095 RepID=A0A0A1GYK0_9LACO|nr:ABC transporter ATP-binding protein [Paucilactobacillus hokkaidonensis]KRO09773.1 ABC superfamily ATP binding cassette transporter, ABC protein [Paucilactobacillus hokkaidonensis]BAP85561.1 glycine betaine/carnitine/choline ABC transporter, ATP-binding protein [Paucilactobacillus hokkaidonensis JCM 18461]
MLLSLQHLRKEYSGGKIAVDDVTLDIDAGEFICFIGTSGSGKTTTMRMINRMLTQTSGKILINDKDIATMDPVKLRRKLGYVIQNVGLMPHMTIRDNITLVPKLLKWPKEKRDQRAIELIKLAQLPEEFLDRFPAELSGGQQQRIGVVRAFAADQDIILMDEPFGALDPITREALQDLVQDLQQRLGKTFIFVTHDMDEALKLATRIVIMSHGKVVQVDTPDNILKHPANDFVTHLIGEERLIQARPSVTTVGQVMLKSPIYITADKALPEALQMMHDKRVDTLLVTDQERKLVGILGIEELDAQFYSDQNVGQIMDPKVFYVKKESIIRDTVDRILKRGYKNVPVVSDDGKLVGIVTRTTLVDMVYDALWWQNEDNANRDEPHNAAEAQQVADDVLIPDVASKGESEDD